MQKKTIIIFAVLAVALIGAILLHVYSEDGTLSVDADAVQSETVSPELNEGPAAEVNTSPPADVGNSDPLPEETTDSTETPEDSPAPSVDDTDPPTEETYQPGEVNEDGQVYIEGIGWCDIVGGGEEVEVEFDVSPEEWNEQNQTASESIEEEQG